MLTSVIIPVWNGLPLVTACLESVAALDGDPPQIIAVDNGSQDGSADYIAEHFPQVKLVRNQQNLGFGAACNQGMAEAEGDLVVLLNQDTQLAPDWLVQIQAAAAQPDVGIVGCKIHYDDGITIQHAGAWVEWPLGIVHHYGVGEADTGQWDEPGPVEIVTFAAVALRREVVDAVGPFDLGFGLGYYEDVDYCLRARQAGFEIFYEPKATLRHRESSSIGKSDLIHYQYQQGRLRVLLKHLSLRRFLDEFVPAEIESQKLAVRNQADSSSLRWAYLGAMNTATEFYADPGKPGQFGAVLNALHRLYHAAWAETKAHIQESPPALAIPDAQPFVTEAALLLQADMPIPTGPALTLYEPQPSGSPIGPVISRLRRFWYNMAARWGDQHLLGHLAVIMAEQATLAQFVKTRGGLTDRFIAHQAELDAVQIDLNRQLERDIRRLSTQVEGLIAENGRLARQMAEMKSELIQSGQPKQDA